jgi:membrane associated rhomboid family serine protease
VQGVSADRHDELTERTNGFVLVAVMAAVMWVVEIVDAAGAQLDDNGIRPRDVDGLVGVATAPFLHAGFGHLLGNTIPFLILGALIALSGLARVALVTVVVILVGGLGVWLTAPAGSVTVGASGVVFGYAAYLVVRGLYSRRTIHLAGGLIILALYGTTLLFGLVPTPGVSWQGHLFGAIGGIVAARLLDRRAQPATATATV